MIAVLLVAENTSELVLIIIHLSGFFFFFYHGLCYIQSASQNIWFMSFSSNIIHFFFVFTSLLSCKFCIYKKNAQRDLYFWSLFLYVYKAVLWFTLMEIFVCIFSIRTCLRVMCQHKLDLSWAFTLKANVICDVLQNTVITFLWFMSKFFCYSWMWALNGTQQSFD